MQHQEEVYILPKGPVWGPGAAVAKEAEAAVARGARPAVGREAEASEVGRRVILDPGSRILDPGSRILDPGSGTLSGTILVAYMVSYTGMPNKV